MTRRSLSAMAAILSSRALPSSGPYPTLDPFLFCVYHKDQYPPGVNEQMEAPRRGNGQDFNPAAPYRMYHGDKIPGFPQHPHRGFETLTATIDGIIDHADSVGNAGRYGKGDLQWMTAGDGVVHSEMFPLVDMQQDNPTRFFQIWLNLPGSKKQAEPSFAMFWAHQVPKYTTEDGKASATVWAGNYFGVQDKQNAPPADSWASDAANDVAVIHLTIRPGGKLTLPKSHETDVNRSLFRIEGVEGVLVDGRQIDTNDVLTLDPTQEVLIELPASAKTTTEFLWLQGKPIGEPVAQYGPFVMNTQDEIKQAFQDYGRTKFGGWPWPRDDMVFPRTKGRFAKLHGQETAPSDNTTCVAAATTKER